MKKILNEQIKTEGTSKKAIDEYNEKHPRMTIAQAYPQQSPTATKEKEYAIDPNKKKECAIDTLPKVGKANTSRNINEGKCARDLYKTKDTLKSKMESLQKSTRECTPKLKLQSLTANNKNEVRYASDYNKKNEKLK